MALTKHYELTEIEVATIRDALDSHWFGIERGVKDMSPEASPIAQNMKTATRVLLDQFKADYRLWKH